MFKIKTNTNQRGKNRLSESYLQKEIKMTILRFKAAKVQAEFIFEF